MASKQNRSPGFVDPVTKTISSNVQRRLDELGWSHDYLATRVGLCSRSTISRYIGIGTSDRPVFTRWKDSLLVGVAQAIGTTVENLAGVSPPQLEQAFNALFHEPTNLLSKFAEHEECASEFLTFDRIPACPTLTKDVQKRLHLSFFGALAGTDEGVMLLERWELWGNTRREGYLAKGIDDMPTRTTMMLRSDFERLVRLEAPYEFCEPEQAAACLEYICNRCVHERGFQLLLVDDEEVTKRPALATALSGVVALAVMGKHFAFRKYPDHSVYWTERSVEVQFCRKILKRLKQLATYAADEKPVLDELAKYRRMLDDEIRARKERPKKHIEEALADFSKGRVRGAP